MKIGINASFARKENTGIGQVTLNFLKELEGLLAANKKLQQLEFFVYVEEDFPAGFKLTENFTVRKFLPPWRRDDLVRKIWWEKLCLPRRAKRDHCDAFISLYQSATIFPQSILHLMLVHDAIPDIFPEYLDNSRKKFYYSLSKRAAHAADRIVTISSRSEKDLVQRWHLNPAKISVVYPGVDKSFQHEPSPERTRAVLEKYRLKPGYIYAGGGLEMRKNFDGLLRAYHMLQKMHHDGVLKVELPQLVISGKLMPELAPLITDVAALTQTLHLTHNVHLLGFVPSEDLPILYRQARLFVYPSKYEGFGLPVLEAMASGVPVVSSRSSSLPEVGGDAVQYFDTNQDHEIADAIEKMLTDHQTREVLRHRGLERAKQFSWEKFSRSVLDILLALTSQRS